MFSPEYTQAQQLIAIDKTFVAALWYWSNIDQEDAITGRRRRRNLSKSRGKHGKYGKQRIRCCQATGGRRCHPNVWNPRLERWDGNVKIFRPVYRHWVEVHFQVAVHFFTSRNVQWSRRITKSWMRPSSQRYNRSFTTMEKARWSLLRSSQCCETETDQSENRYLCIRISTRFKYKLVRPHWFWYCVANIHCLKSEPLH